MPIFGVPAHEAVSNSSIWLVILSGVRRIRSQSSRETDTSCNNRHNVEVIAWKVCLRRLSFLTRVNWPVVVFRVGEGGRAVLNLEQHFRTKRWSSPTIPHDITAHKSTIAVFLRAVQSVSFRLRADHLEVRLENALASSETLLPAQRPSDVSLHLLLIHPVSPFWQSNFLSLCF